MIQYEKDMASPHRDLFLQAREFLLSFDGIQEIKKPRITTYSNSGGGICHLRTMPHGIDFGFLKGARMNDAHSRLTGNGKAMRVLSLNQLNADIVRYFVTQAIEINR